MDKNRPLLWALLLLLAEAVLIAVLVPTRFLDRMTETESGWMSTMYSESTYSRMDQSTDEWHHTLTRKTGLSGWLHYMFFPSEEAKKREKGMSRLGDKLWFPYIESRGEALDSMLKTFLMRLWSIGAWLPLLILVTVPSVFEGVMERKIKQHTFKYPSPFMYRHGVRGSVLSMFLLFVCLCAPFPIPPVIFPVTVIVTIVVMSIVVIGNLPKRL